MLLDERGEGGVDLVLGAGFQDIELHPLGARRQFGIYTGSIPRAASPPTRRSSSRPDLVGADEDRRRHGEAGRLGGLEIDDQLESVGWPL